jgi:hypothetical protein
MGGNFFLDLLRESKFIVEEKRKFAGFLRQNGKFRGGPYWLSASSKMTARLREQREGNLEFADWTFFAVMGGELLARRVLARVALPCDSSDSDPPQKRGCLCDEKHDEEILKEREDQLQQR